MTDSVVALFIIVLKHAYRYLHFKIIPVQLDSDVCDSFLKEPGRSQHQHQLQVPWKCPLHRSSIN